MVNFIYMSKYPFTLEPLLIDYADLEPVIDQETMHIHHDKHHQAYLDNLNKLLAEKSEWQEKTLDELLVVEPGGVRNNAGGVWNHNLFFAGMIGVGKSVMSEEWKKVIEDNFGSVEKFMGDFELASLGRFGSGWSWLVKNSEGKLEILSTPNQDNPLLDGKKPLLCLDVWEHSYYLKYQNRRAEYVKAYWQVVNWERVEELYRS